MATTIGVSHTRHQNTTEQLKHVFMVKTIESLHCL
jgi:hypothetical protein